MLDQYPLSRLRNEAEKCKKNVKERVHPHGIERHDNLRFIPEFTPCQSLG